MNTVQFLTMPGCHSCKKAKQIFDKITPDFPQVEVKEFDMGSPEGQELVQKYSVMASPGIIINNELFSTGGVDEGKLVEKLQSLSV